MVCVGWNYQSARVVHKQYLTMLNDNRTFLGEKSLLRMQKKIIAVDKFYSVHLRHRPIKLYFKEKQSWRELLSRLTIYPKLWLNEISTPDICSLSILANVCLCLGLNLNQSNLICINLNTQSIVVSIFAPTLLSKKLKNDAWKREQYNIATNHRFIFC